MKKQVFNPYLPNYEYVPDGEPYVFGSRVYVYGSHDKFNGERFCENDYVCWSASVDDLSDWKNEGVIYCKTQDPDNTDGSRCLYAPDVEQGLDGRYYLYYALDTLGIISAAVCDTPAGKYEYYGTVHYPNGKSVGEERGDIYQFDPGLFIDDQRIFLYTGFGQQSSPMADAMFGGRRYVGAYCIELEADMLTVKARPKLILPKVGFAEKTSFEGHEFFEASSMRKIGKTYYFIYSSIKSHELCYAVSDRPEAGFTYGGTIISNGDIYLDGRTVEDCVNYIGNNHGSLISIKGQWFIFYHRHTNRHEFSRQACAEKVFIDEEGHIRQVEMTSCGLNDGPLEGIGRYEAYIACNLYGKEGAGYYTQEKNKYRNHPYFTQTGEDREENGDQYIANMQDGAVAGFKYFDMSETMQIGIEIRGNAKGSMTILNGQRGEVVASITVNAQETYRLFKGKLKVYKGISALYFRYNGLGYLDFRAFILE